MSTQYKAIVEFTRELEEDIAQIKLNDTRRDMPRNAALAAQLSSELQEASNQYGLPAGDWHVTKVELPDDSSEQFEPTHIKRRYTSTAEVEVGDVVVMANDDAGFNTSIVEKIDGEDEWIYVHLVRPIARVDATTGSVWTSAERYKVLLRQFVDRFVVYTTGASGNKDNRRG